MSAAETLDRMTEEMFGKKFDELTSEERDKLIEKLEQINVMDKP